MTVEKIGTGTQRERDAAINANFKALDTGKLGKTETAADSSKLGGVAAANYATTTAMNSAIEAAKTAVKDELIDGAPATYDTLKEIADYIAEDKTGAAAMNEAIANKLGKTETAAAAAKLTTSAGSATQPVFFSNGVPVATTYSLGKSVPANALFTDTTYSVATTTANGLMASADKTKLDGIAAGANNYTLPTATASVLGGVKIGSNININSDVISVNNASTTQKGVVQLIDSSVTEDYTKAPTAAAMKRTWELASGKQNPETTLSGYGITDAYTKTEVDNKITEAVAGAAVLKTEFTASSANWGTLSDGYYPFTLAASGKHFLGMYRTNGSTYESVMVDAVESGSNIIIQSTEKFAGFILTI